MQYPRSCPMSHPCSWRRHIFSAGSSSSREHAPWVRHSSWSLPGTLYNNVEKRKCVWSGLTWKVRPLSTEMERGAPMPRWKLLIRPLILTTTFGSSAILGCVWRNSFQGEKWKPWQLSLWLPDNCPLFPDIHPSLLVLALRLLLTGTLGYENTSEEEAAFPGLKEVERQMRPGLYLVLFPCEQLPRFPPSCSRRQCFSSFFKTLGFPGRRPKLIQLVMFPKYSVIYLFISLFIWLFFYSANIYSTSIYWVPHMPLC